MDQIQKKLRGGYTTGACAAAGAKAALLYESGADWHQVVVTALDGPPLDIPVKSMKETPDGIQAEVIKQSGDDPDITNGVSVYTTVRHLSAAEAGEMAGELEDGICFRAGEGIGHVTKPGLQLPVGSPAINPGPRQLIRQSVLEVAGSLGAPLVITISIPAGRELARRTLNPILGIEGGISVIGSTGVLRPMSEEGFKNSLVPQISVAQAAGFRDLVFVPGKIGERIGTEWGLPSGAFVQTSNFIGFMLEAAADRQVRSVLLFGHIGKLAKVAGGSFYTHNRIADGRLETLAAHAAVHGLPPVKVKAVLASKTTEEALLIIAKAGLSRIVCDELCTCASQRSERFLFGKMTVGTAMVDYAGHLLGIDDQARAIGQRFGWRVPDEQ